jgi:hypothetical protein
MVSLFSGLRFTLTNKAAAWLIDIYGNYIDGNDAAAVPAGVLNTGGFPRAMPFGAVWCA